MFPEKNSAGKVCRPKNISAEKVSWPKCFGPNILRPKQFSAEIFGHKNFQPKFVFAGFFFRCRKMNRWKSSEMRFGKVLHRSEPSLRGKRPSSGRRPSGENYSEQLLCLLSIGGLSNIWSIKYGVYRTFSIGSHLARLGNVRRSFGGC